MTVTYTLFSYYLNFNPTILFKFFKSAWPPSRHNKPFSQKEPNHQSNVPPPSPIDWPWSFNGNGILYSPFNAHTLASLVSPRRPIFCCWSLLIIICAYKTTNIRTELPNLTTSEKYHTTKKLYSSSKFNNQRFIISFKLNISTFRPFSHAFIWPKGWKC